jgi:ribA/ribD-fused uncharacterized protein
MFLMRDDIQSASTANVIRFSSLREDYGFFSNFAPTPIVLRGKTWSTVEHFFQAQKFAGTAHQDAIRLARSPTIAARMGRSRQRPLRSDWEQARDGIMLQGLRAKFTQHADLRAVLLATGDALIIEHRARDAYWGDGPDGRGKNRLGHLLMQLRKELAAAR